MTALGWGLATHPLLREIVTGSVMAVWPVWLVLAVVFGVAAGASR